MYNYSGFPVSPQLAPSPRTSGRSLLHVLGRATDSVTFPLQVTRNPLVTGYRPASSRRLHLPARFHTADLVLLTSTGLLKALGLNSPAGTVDVGTIHYLCLVFSMLVVTTVRQRLIQHLPLTLQI